jgi:large-conductance mechanosensitive channel
MVTTVGALLSLGASFVLYSVCAFLCSFLMVLLWRCVWVWMAGKHVQAHVREMRERLSDTVDHSTNRRTVIHEIRLAYSVDEDTISHPKWLPDSPLFRRELESSVSIVLHPDHPSLVELKFNLIEKCFKLSFMLMILLGGLVGCAVIGYYSLLGNETPARITQYGRVTSVVLAFFHTAIFVYLLIYVSTLQQDDYERVMDNPTTNDDLGDIARQEPPLVEAVLSVDKQEV